MYTSFGGKRHAFGFTLIELLVVIDIIAILSAILFPVFARVRAKARQITCVSNEKQMGLAFMQYIQDYDEKLPFDRNTTAANVSTPAELEWKDGIYPYLQSGGRPYNNGQPLRKSGQWRPPIQANLPSVPPDVLCMEKIKPPTTHQ